MKTGNYIVNHAYCMAAACCMAVSSWGTLFCIIMVVRSAGMLRSRPFKEGWLQ